MGGITRAVADYLREADLSGTTRDQAAAHFGMTSAKLMHGLTDEGTNFRDLVNRERATRAYNMMKNNPDIPVTHLAGALDFADVGSVSRAWPALFGCTLGEFRDRLRGDST